MIFDISPDSDVLAVLHQEDEVGRRRHRIPDQTERDAILRLHQSRLDRALDVPELQDLVVVLEAVLGALSLVEGVDLEPVARHKSVPSDVPELGSVRDRRFARPRNARLLGHLSQLRLEALRFSRG